MPALSELKNASPIRLLAMDLKIVADTMEEVKNFLENRTKMEPVWFQPALTCVQSLMKTINDHVNDGHDLMHFDISPDLNYIAKKLAMAQNILEGATQRCSWIDSSLAIVRDYATLLDKDGQKQKQVIDALHRQNDALYAQNAAMKDLLLSQHGIASGLEVLEAAFAKHRKADPLDAPIPLVGSAAKQWHRQQAETYQHALEMLSSETVLEFCAQLRAHDAANAPAEDAEDSEGFRPDA